MTTPRMTAIANNMLLKSNIKEKHYKLFTEEGWQKILEEKRKRKLKDLDKHRRFDEGKLVDGELKFDMDDCNEDLQPDPDLEAGSILCEERFGSFPVNLLGKPLEEIDQNLKDKSFVVINTRFKIKYIFRYTATKSFFLCAPWNFIRKIALFISTNQIFDYFIMLTILVNCVFLALNDDYPISEYIFLAIYTLEMVIRMTARGLIINSYTYLRDPYNLVDILIIILSYIMIIIEKFYGQNNVNVSSLRTLRVLRALKTITILPGLKTITSALIKSLKMLFEVIVLSLFCMSFFALFALQIYQGTLRNKCVINVNWKTAGPLNMTDIHSFYYNWTNNSSNWIQSGMNYLTCGNDSSAGNCSRAHPNATCLPNIGPNPNFGYTNFDNFGWALLSVFQLITLDFWENQYNLIIRSSGSWNILFYIIVVFFGSFYLINLMLAVVSMSYEEEARAQNREDEKEKIRKIKSSKKKKKTKRKKRLSIKKYNNVLDGNLQIKEAKNGNSNGNEIIKIDDESKSFEVKLSDTEDDLRYMDSEDEDGNEEECEEELEDDVEARVATKIDISEESRQMTDRNCLCCARPNKIYKKWVIFQSRLYIFVTDPFFDLFISFCIFINTIIMACEHYPPQGTWEILLKYSNIFFTAIYIMECFLKIMSMSKEYFKVGWNIFDFVVVIASIIDLGVEEVDALSIFRAFRLFRVFKLAQSWQTMRLLLTIIFSTVTEMGNLSIIVVLVLYMFAVIGKQSYRNTYHSNTFGDKIPRWNFNDFWHSMILVFRVICGEWIEPSFDCIRANGELCLLLFIPTLVLGNFVVLNLFLALLLNSFASDSLKNTADDDISKFKIAMDRLRSISPWPRNKLANEKIEKHQSFEDRLNADTVKSSVVDIIELQNNLDPCGEIKSQSLSVKLLNVANAQSTVDDQDEAVKKLNCSVEGDNCSSSGVKQITFNLKQEKLNERSLTDNSNERMDIDDDEEEVVELKDCCFSFCYNPFQEKKPCHRCYCIVCDVQTPSGIQWYNFRNKILSVTEHKIFEGVVLVCILASSVCLCFEDIYLDNNPTLKHALKIINYIFTSLFCIEMVLKIISLGFRVYFTSFWTILDFFIVSISFLSLLNDLIGFGTEMTAFRSLRTMRALRPLRAISRWQGMKIVVNALIYAIPSIFNVLLVCVVFWLIFSITGVQFFKGKFFKCLDKSTGERLVPSVVPNKNECLRQNYTWVNSNINFDNATNGFLALYQIATFEGWMEIMQDAIDSTDINMQPKKENHIAYYIYFVIFILVGSFFILNLFIGVIIDNFNRLKNKYEGNYIDVFLTASQRSYYNTMKKLSNRKPRKTVRRPKALLQGFFYDVAMSNRFELVIVVLIFLNMVVMMVEHYKQSATFTNILEMINIMFSTIFTLEAVVKITGLRWHYFRIIWNIFDFIIVILSIVDLIINLFRSFSDFADETLKTPLITPTLLRVVRIFRIGRVLRLIKVAKGIRKLLFALVISLPALFNIGALLLLIVFIYAIVGMSVFGNLKKTGGLDDLVNFETFERSMLLLFRLTTAGGWNDVLEAMFIQPPYCNNSFVVRENTVKAISNGDCGIAWFGILYMTTFIFICYLIIINMYIAIILENFNQAHDQEEVGITEDDFEMFYLVWERYDPHASQYIKYESLSDFVAELDEPLGIPKPNMIALVSFDLPIVEDDKMHCLDILIALVKHVIGDVEDSEEFRKIKRQMETKYQEVFPTRVHTNVITTTMERKKQDIAAKTLQRAWQHVKAQKAFKYMSENATLSSRHDLHYCQGSKQNSAGTAGQMIDTDISGQSFLKVPQLSKLN